MYATWQEAYIAAALKIVAAKCSKVSVVILKTMRKLSF